MNSNRQLRRHGSVSQDAAVAVGHVVGLAGSTTDEEVRRLWKQWNKDGLYILCSAEVMLKPATTFLKMTPFTQVVCVVSEAKQEIVGGV